MTTASRYATIVADPPWRREEVTDIQIAREEIQTQRNALMVGTHVRHYPSKPGEGCLVMHVLENGTAQQLERVLSHRALEWAIARLGYPVPAYGVADLNDGKGDYPGLTASEAIAILDEALLVLKDYEAGLA